jgi:hypothetical protein
MNDQAQAPDKIESAIAAADVPQLRQWAATIASTGRAAAILLPVDATDGEIAEFCGWVLGPVMATYRVERAKKAHGGLLLPDRPQLVRARRPD